MGDDKIDDVKTEDVGGGMTNEGTKATGYNESGDKVAEGWGEGRGPESQAEAIEEMHDEAAENREDKD